MPTGDPAADVMPKPSDIAARVNSAQPDTGASGDEPASANPSTLSPEEQIAHWRAEARKHEDKWREKSPWIKELKDKARRLEEIEEASKTADQKAAERLAAAEKDALEARSELARTKSLLKYGLAEEDADLLGSGTPEEIDARAQRLADRLKAAAPPPPPPPPAPPATGQGKQGEPLGDADLDTRIAAAQQAGNWREVLSLNNQKLAVLAAARKD